MISAINARLRILVITETCVQLRFQLASTPNWKSVSGPSTGGTALKRKPKFKCLSVCSSEWGDWKNCLFFFKENYHNFSFRGRQQKYSTCSRHLCPKYNIGEGLANWWVCLTLWRNAFKNKDIWLFDSVKIQTSNKEVLGPSPHRLPWLLTLTVDYSKILATSPGSSW